MDEAATTNTNHPATQGEKTTKVRPPARKVNRSDDKPSPAANASNGVVPASTSQHTTSAAPTTAKNVEEVASKKPKSRRRHHRQKKAPTTGVPTTTATDPTPAPSAPASQPTTTKSTKRKSRPSKKKAEDVDQSSSTVAAKSEPLPKKVVNKKKVVLDVSKMCNNLMITDVATRLLPKHQAYVRSAGMAGISVFEEMAVGLKVVPLAVEVLGGKLLMDDATTTSKKCCHFPVGTAITSKCGRPMRPLQPGTLVVNQAAMIRHQRIVPYMGWEQMVWTDARFEPASPSEGSKEKDILTELCATRITLGSAFEQYTSVPNGFLKCCRGVKFPIDLSPFRNVTRIGNEFLTCCGSLTEVDLSPFQNVTEIGSYFMFQATSCLKHFDASPLSKVTRIGESFLSRSELSTIDLSPMINLEEIPNNFLHDCACLKSLKLPNLAASTRKSPVRIHDYFLCDCPSLLEVDLTPIGAAVTVIGSYFMARCGSLTTINLGPLSNLTTIGTHWLGGCKGLVDGGVDLTPLSSSLASIGKMFMHDCTSLTHMDLSPMTSLSSMTALPEGILHSCSGLRTVVFPRHLDYVNKFKGSVMEGCHSLIGPVDLSMFGRVSIIGGYFFYGCSSMPSLDLSPLINVNTIEYGFMAGCASLVSIDFTALRNVVTIGEHFASGCTTLTSMDLSPFTQLRVVGEHFASGCTGLTTVDLSPLTSLKTIQHHFMSKCTGLTTVTIGTHQHNNITKVGKGFFEDCPNLPPVDLSVFVNAQTDMM